jgi:hypothetical protein
MGMFAPLAVIQRRRQGQTEAIHPDHNGLDHRAAGLASLHKDTARAGTLGHGYLDSQHAT